MSMMQLTVVVAVNMMGSGHHHAADQHGAGRRDLAAVLDRDRARLDGDRLRLRPGGIFNQRPGGMSAYAEDAYGKAGYFVMFLLYFFSLAIGNVAIAISAVGYLAGFFPGMSATPIATCISVIALIWLTTVANFGGPSHHRQDRLGDGVGRDHPGRRPVDHRLVLVQRRRLRARRGTRRA